MNRRSGVPLAATRPADPRHEREGWFDRSTLTSSLLESVDRVPDRTAVVDGSQTLSYRELSRRAQAFARGLQALGVARGDVVTVQLPNWWEAIVACHGTLALGAVVNPVIPIYRDAEVGFIVDEARPRALVIPHRFRDFDFVAMAQRAVARHADPPTVMVVRPEGPLPDGFLAFDDVCDDATVDESDTDDAPIHDAVAEDICLLLYTSGTTADPKGVLHSHQTLSYENRSIIDLFGLSDTDAVFMPSPVTHITGFLYGVLLPPMLGVAAVLLDIWAPAAALELVQRHRCRFTVGATPFLQGLTDAYERVGIRSELTTFACGGADVPPELVRTATDVLGAAVMRVYGSSEFPTVSCGHPDDPLDLRATTDGRPIGPVECRLNPSDAATGELLVSGPEMFLGYLDAALNGDAFTADGFFRTGDLATISADGAVTIRGRLKDIIIRNGENISAREVEDLLYEHPIVADAAVVAMPDEQTGEKACAFVVPTPGAALTLDEICTHLETRRVARQKFPERLEIVDELPRTASGKVQKFLLRDRLRDLVSPSAGSD